MMEETYGETSRPENGCSFDDSHSDYSVLSEESEKQTKDNSLRKSSSNDCCIAQAVNSQAKCQISLNGLGVTEEYSDNGMKINITTEDHMNQIKAESSTDGYCVAKAVKDGNESHVCGNKILSEVGDNYAHAEASGPECAAVLSTEGSKSCWQVKGKRGFIISTSGIKQKNKESEDNFVFKKIKSLWHKLPSISVGSSNNESTPVDATDQKVQDHDQIPPSTLQLLKKTT